MKWIGITGSWRKTNKEVEKDVRDVVKKIINAGNGIVTGGALNVDYFAAEEAIKLKAIDKIKIYLPVTLEIYAGHYRKRTKEGIITEKQASQLIRLLKLVKRENPNSVIENRHHKIVDTTTYFERNQSIIDASDQLFAFQVNNSPGVSDTINKAKKKGIPVQLFSYTIE